MLVETSRIKYYLDRAIEEKNAIKPSYNAILELTDMFSVIRDEGKQTLNTSTRNIDSDILDSISALVSYIMSSILPKSGQWADLEIDELRMRDEFGDNAQKSIDEINQYLGADVEKTFRYIQNSNYYEEVVKAMKSYVRVGTGCYAIRETGIPSKPFIYEYVGLDNLFILNDNFSKPNIIFKKHPDVNADYLRDIFGKDIKLPSNLDESIESKTTVYECVIPEYNEENAITVYNYIVATESLDEILLEKQLEYNVFCVFRWDTIEGNSWGSSVVMEQEGLLNELKSYQELYNTQAKRIANPSGIFYGNSELFNELSMEEGTLNYGGNPQIDGIGGASLQVIGGSGNLMPLDKLISDCRMRFKKSLMVDHLTTNIQDIKYGTAYAVSILHEMFRQRFANTYELLNSELVEPTFLAPFIILLRYGQLNLTKEVLPYVAIRYKSELSKANNVADVNKVIQYTQYVGQLKQANQMGIALNMPKTIAYVSDKLEIDKSLVPSESELVEIQEYEKQIMMQQAMAQQQGGMNDGTNMGNEQGV